MAVRTRGTDNARGRKAQAAEHEVKQRVKKAVDERKAQPHPEWNRPEGVTDEAWRDGCRVRELREQGMAWWAIAHEMGLPGSADNVKQGKTGAGHARRLYKKAFGELPESTRTANAKLSPEERAERKRSRRGKADVVKGNAAERLEAMTDAEVVDFLAGKSIKWTTSLPAGDSLIEAEQECRVGLKPRMMEGKRGRYVTFNEPGAGSRSIYLACIHTVGI